jgi:hypothetical protein
MRQSTSRHVTIRVWAGIAAFAFAGVAALGRAEPVGAGHRAMEIFPLTDLHVHGSSIVELPNGDLLACWFEGSGERWADDVAIMGSRLIAGSEAWSEPFVMADVPEFPDINPTMFIDPRGTLWLV